MKYWKNIKRGWKRIHYAVSFIFSIILSSLFLGGEEEMPLAFILFLLFYFLIVIIIEWIKEGFKKNE